MSTRTLVKATAVCALGSACAMLRRTSLQAKTAKTDTKPLSVPNRLEKTAKQNFDASVTSVMVLPFFLCCPYFRVNTGAARRHPRSKGWKQAVFFRVFHHVSLIELAHNHVAKFQSRACLSLCVCVGVYVCTRVTSTQMQVVLVHAIRVYMHKSLNCSMHETNRLLRKQNVSRSHECTRSSNGKKCAGWTLSHFQRIAVLYLTLGTCSGN